MSATSATATSARLRERFANLDESTYLVSHSMGAAPLAAREALVRYWNEWSREGPEAWDAWLPECGEIADNLGAIFGAPRGTVSLAPNVSLLQAALGSALSFTPDRNEVIYEELMFPSITYVWKAWEKFGARTTVVRSDDGRTTSIDRLCSAVTERTKVVVVSHAAFVSAAILDVATLAARCRDVGALLVLDTYQTAGVYPFDVVELGVDVATGGSHKWLLGGPGCGYIYVRPELRNDLAPAITGWMAHAAPFAFEPAPIRYATDVHRWNSGTPTIPGYLVARPGHDLIREVGIQNIRAHNVRLTDRIAALALERNFTVPTPLDPPKRTGWVGLDFAGADRVAKALHTRRIFVDYRPGCGIRVSPHFYTTDAEIDTFFAAVDDLRVSTA
ncbi:MAG: aminotransferase class V-fold PLP-dependent enzyme [Candidatus Baltobacteraceae bacterium]